MDNYSFAELFERSLFDSYDVYINNKMNEA